MNAFKFAELINSDNLKKLSSGTYYVNKTSVSSICYAFFVSSVRKIIESFFSIFQANWYEAKSFCELIGSQLATFETKEEMKQVAENSGYSCEFLICERVRCYHNFYNLSPLVLGVGVRHRPSHGQVLLG